MGIFGPKMGTWSVYSKSDSRWNNSGRGEGLVCEGGPQEMKEWVDKCTADYGDQPDDLMVSFMKD